MCLVSILFTCRSVTLSFALYHSLYSPSVARKETVMVEPGERSNFAGSALFLSISVVLYVFLRVLQERRNSNSLNYHYTHTHTQTD